MARRDDRAAHQLLSFAREQGADGLWIDQTGKHAKLRGFMQGRKFMLVFAKSTSCHRSMLNAKAQLRHTLSQNNEGAR